MDGWTIAWLVWIGAFFAIEIPAVRNRQKGIRDSNARYCWSIAALELRAALAAPTPTEVQP